MGSCISTSPRAGGGVVISEQSYLSDLSNIALSSEQIFQINNQRNAYLQSVRDEVDFSNERERPDLTDDLKDKYSDITNGNTKNINRLSYNSLQQLKDRAQYDLDDQKRMFVRRSDLYGYNVYYDGNDKGGQRWSEGIIDIKNAENTLTAIKSAIKVKAENYVKRKR